MDLIKKINDLNAADLEILMKRSEIDISGVEASVKAIIEEVRQNGGEAVKKYCLKFDKAELTSLKVSESEFDEAEKNISPEIKNAIAHAVTNVKKYHEAQLPKAMDFFEIEPGVFAGEKAVPISSAGLYVPRGRGNFPSMLYMLAAPAVIAGVPQICITTPAGEDGKVDAACLYAARTCGVNNVFKAGGAQGIAAMAFGAGEYPKTEKIVGPGSVYVTAAKRLLSDEIDPGLPAGPSESLIYADGSADPYLLALDLLIESEHGSDSCALIVTESEKTAQGAAAELEKLLKNVPVPRKTFIEESFEKYGAVIVTGSTKESIKFINDFAAEHLQLHCRSPFDILSEIKNAGEIILGGNTPFSAANYIVGANAVLPTGGKSRTWGPVSVRDFIKYSSVIYCTDRGMNNIKTDAALLAKYEGFPCHYNGLTQRDTK